MTYSIRDATYELSTPWMRGPYAATINRALASVLDALGARVEEGIKARFPISGTPTALGYLGNDRGIERGPTQSDGGYGAQLQAAFDTWQNAGGGRTILSQLRLYFAPGNGPPMRLVAEWRSDPSASSTGNVWHEINTSTGVVMRSYVSDANWRWREDGDNAGPWFYGWAIIDVSGIWALDYWGEPGNWGDGGVWGSNMPLGVAESFNRILAKWKPANVQGRIVLVFDTMTFLRTDTTFAFNPNGDGYTYAWQAMKPANFFSLLGI